MPAPTADVAARPRWSGARGGVGEAARCAILEP